MAKPGPSPNHGRYHCEEAERQSAARRRRHHPALQRHPHLHAPAATLTEPTEVDIALIGVPWDGGTTNRAGARHGPREIRNMSSFMRKVHHVSRIAPYDLARIADLGDAPVNPIDLMDTLGRIERFYAEGACGRRAAALGRRRPPDHAADLPRHRARTARSA